MACLRTFGVAAVATVAAAQNAFLATTRQPEADASAVANATERVLQANLPLFEGEIRWAGKQNVCLDLAGGRQDNGNRFQAWECTGSANQKFLYNPNEELPQIKLAANPRKCLDNGGSFENFAEIVLYDCHPLDHPDRKHQAFRVSQYATEQGTQIHWEADESKCVDLDNGVVGSRSQSDSKVITYDCHNYGEEDYDHQIWVLNNGSPVSLCAVQFSSDACSSNPQCSWCNRPPASCFNAVEQPESCMN